MERKSAPVKNTNTIDTNKKVVTSESPISEGVKYQMLFLESASFQSKVYEKGTILEVEEWVKEAYSKRTVLQFTPIRA